MNAHVNWFLFRVPPNSLLPRERDQVTGDHFTLYKLSSNFHGDPSSRLGKMVSESGNTGMRTNIVMRSERTSGNTDTSFL